MDVLMTKIGGENWLPENVLRMKEIIVADFADLFKRTPDEQLYWIGTKRDLVELSHMVWETGCLLDNRGVPLDFKTIVRQICEVLHVDPPKHPSGVIDKIRQCKHIKVKPLTERYLYLLYRQSIPDPMRLDIKRRHRKR